MIGGSPAGAFRQNLLIGFSVKNPFMAALYKILRLFAVVLANLFCDGVYHKSLLQQHIPNDFLVANQVNDGVPSHVGAMPAFDIHGGKGIFQLIPPVTFQIEVGGQPYDLGLLRYDFQPPVDLPVTYMVILQGRPCS